jgi:CheY-like chemotaxis protein
MPGMNGVELATAIKRSNPQCKILLFSGHASTMDLLARARLAGHHFHLLSKPIHPNDMLRRVSEFLGSSATMPPPQPASRLRWGIALDRSLVQ